MRKRKNKARLCPINIRITKDRKSSYIQTGQRIDPKFWDSVKRKMKKNHPNSTRLNNLISFKLAEINKSLLNIEAKTKPLTRVTEIKKAISGKHKSHSFTHLPKPILMNLIKTRSILASIVNDPY